MRSTQDTALGAGALAAAALFLLLAVGMLVWLGLWMYIRSLRRRRSHGGWGVHLLQADLVAARLLAQQCKPLAIMLKQAHNR